MWFWFPAKVSWYKWNWYQDDFKGRKVNKIPPFSFFFFFVLFSAANSTRSIWRQKNKTCRHVNSKETETAWKQRQKTNDQMFKTVTLLSFCIIVRSKCVRFLDFWLGKTRCLTISRCALGNRGSVLSLVCSQNEYWLNKKNKKTFKAHIHTHSEKKRCLNCSFKL